MEEIIKKIEKEIKELFSNDFSGHDFYHLKRVYYLALKLQESEGGDRYVIGVSAILHDVHRVIEKNSGKFCSPKESVEKVNSILKKCNVEKSKIAEILNCIEFHEEHNFAIKNITPTKETLILQDADNLDGLGAIGIGRAFAYGGFYKIPLWLPEIEIQQNNSLNCAFQDTSTIHHFYNQLLKLENNMNTKTGKIIAHKRTKFMKSFLKQFFFEWDMKDNSY